MSVFGGGMEQAVWIWEHAPYNAVMTTWYRLPDYRYERDYFRARTAYLTQYQGRSKDAPEPPEFMEWLPEWAKPAAWEAVAAKEAVYSEAIVASAEQLKRLHLLSQVALVALSPRALRASGAWPKGKTRASTAQKLKNII